MGKVERTSCCDLYLMVQCRMFHYITHHEVQPINNLIRHVYCICDLEFYMPSMTDNRTWGFMKYWFFFFHAVLCLGLYVRMCFVSLWFHLTVSFSALFRTQKMKKNITTSKKCLWMKDMLSLSARAPCWLADLTATFKLSGVFHTVGTYSK